ncbi:DUF4179 domain-containing protein [Anaerovorax odorimutans]|uniref:DUF4179 domain-containing protein n=1 Tax=Anaerovorax odorimutans TaxID=109327 RepID=UPI000417D121|nr:DUF4179 domain-containing protein [Anaerovorax odorimutans]
MKKLYSLLNNVEINLDDYNKEELTDMEKRKMIRGIKQMNGDKNKRKKYKVAAACIVALIIATGTIGFNDTAYAAARNVAWQIGNFLGIEKNLQDYTTVIGTSKTNKGYTITLNEVILDDNQLVVSSSAKSDKKLSQRGISKIADIYVNGKRASVAGGGSSRIVDEYTEESLIAYELEGVNTNGKLDIEIIYDSIFVDQQEIKGKWDFHFEADGAKLSENTTRISLNKSFNLPNGSQVILTEYSSNDLGQKIYFKLKDWDVKKDPMYDLKLEGTDNLGNEVEFDVSYIKGDEKSGRLNIDSITGNISEDADSITLKPYAAKMPEKSGKMNNEFVQIGDAFTINLL